jgi:integrase/recombinase XerD
VGTAHGPANHRLAAIRSLYHYAALRHPEHAATIARVLAIPSKRHDRRIVNYLTQAAALLSAPDRNRWIGRRDHALMTLAIQTGLRVSEVIALRCRDVNLTAAPHVQALGKGRNERITPLTKTTADVLRAWTRERAGSPDDPLFPTTRGRPLSRNAVARRLIKHASTASPSCPTQATKTVTPHVLRHTTGMNLLHAGVDTSVIALVRPRVHRSHADLPARRHGHQGTRTRTRHTPIGVKPGRYRPTDALLAFLEDL